MDEWRMLIQRYADETHIPCNCGNAYDSPEKRCQYGCDASNYIAKRYVAKKVLEELAQ